MAGFYCFSEITRRSFKWALNLLSCEVTNSPPLGGRVSARLRARAQAGRLPTRRPVRLNTWQRLRHKPLLRSLSLPCQSARRLLPADFCPPTSAPGPREAARLLERNAALPFHKKTLSVTVYPVPECFDIHSVGNRLRDINFLSIVVAGIIFS